MLATVLGYIAAWCAVGALVLAAPAMIALVAVLRHPERRAAPVMGLAVALFVCLVVWAGVLGILSSALAGP